MRSLREYLFRAGQEVSTLRLLVQIPNVEEAVNSVARLPLPDPSRVSAHLGGTVLHSAAVLLMNPDRAFV